ncbi:MAG TPA: DMT family transporter [Clostridia bacterium]|nr:DMT family transporter [Clostridia bacterium]
MGVLCGIFSHVLFALSFLFTKEAVNTYSAFTLLSWRFLFALAAMGALALVGVIKLNLRGKSLWPLVLIAIFQPVLYFIGETYGVKLTTASESGSLVTFLPIVTIVLCSLIIKERPTKPQVIGIVISVAGVLTMVLAKGLDASLNVLGYLMIVLAMTSDGLSVTFQRKAMNYSAQEKTFMMAALGAITFTGFALAENGIKGTIPAYLAAPFTDMKFLTGVLYLSVGCQVLAFLMANYAIHAIGPARCTSFAGITTVVAVLAGVVFLREQFTLLQGVGTVLVLVGVYTANYMMKAKGVEALPEEETCPARLDP